MNYTHIENYLRAFSFSCVFFTMLFYWIKATFFHTRKNINTEKGLVFICNISLMILLILRWLDSNHFPLSNLYESLIFLCWSLTAFLLFIQIKFNDNFIGILITPIILFTNTFATFSLPQEMQKASSLVPALQSNWLMMHVTIMMLSYAALIFGSLLAIAFLVIDLTTIKTYAPSFTNLLQLDLVSSGLAKSSKKNWIFKIDDKKENQTDFQKNNPALLLKLDNLSYRTLGIGFPLLTIGILSGAVWANETWGSYWNWDPKETWALITWFIYAIYLHSRIIKGWNGKKPAMIASFGFLAVWVCYLGVNLFGKGLHSYGWFS